MTRKFIYTIIFAINLIFIPSSLASVNTSTPPVATSTIGGSLGGRLPINQLGTYDTSFNALKFTTTSDFKIYVADDIQLTRYPYKIWKNVTMGDSNLSSNMTVNFNGAELEYTSVNLSGASRTLELGTLNLDHVDALIDTNLELKFADSNNVINLKNSAIRFSGVGANTISTAPFTINSESGSNEFYNWSGEIYTQSIAINVKSGSSLLFDYSGDISDTASNTEKLYFSSPVTGNVNNAAMTLNYSNIYFNSSVFNFENNSTLTLTGSGSKVEFENVAFNASKLVLQNNTTFKARDLAFANSMLNLNSGAQVNTNLIEVTADSSLSGTDLAGAGLYAKNFILRDNVTFEHNGSRVDVSKALFLNSGSQLNIDGYGTLFSATGMYSDGATVNVTNLGEFRLNGSLYAYPMTSATFNVDATSSLSISQNATLLKAPTIVINNDGYLSVDGYLIGSGSILGSGKVFVSETGQISPDSIYTTGGDIGTLSFENSVKFTNNGILGNQSQSQYIAHIDVIGGSETNDLLQYNNQDFDTTGLTSIKVDTQSIKTADELHGKSFTIVSSLNAASTGTLITGGSYPLIVESSNIPALIDFSLSDNNTNTHADITLNATKQGASSLITHPSVTTTNQTGSANLLVNASNSGNTTVNNALNTLTNGQVDSHFDSVHAEPYSSYMTVSLEQIDLVRTSVMSHASSTKNGISQGNNHIKEDKNTKSNFWMDALHVDGNVDEENQLGGFNYKLSSITLGQDLVNTNENVFGIYFSYGTQNMDEHDIATQNLKGSLYHLGAYYDLMSTDNWNIRSVVGYSYGDHKSTRYVTLGNHNSEVAADYGSHSIYAGVTGEVKWIEETWGSISPEVGMAYSYYAQDSFRESGDADLGLAVSGASAQSIITSVGLNAKFSSLSEEFSLYPLAFAKYEYDWYANSNDQHKIDAALISHPDNKEEFVGRNRGNHAANIGLGLGSDIDSATQINGGLVYSKTTHGSEIGGGINFVYAW